MTSNAYIAIQDIVSTVQNDRYEDIRMDHKLIQGCIKGDRKSQRIVYNEYRTSWFILCLRYMANRDDAQDALQNALIQIFTKIDRYDPHKGKFKTWSSKIVVNECLMLLRKNRRGVFVEELTDQPLESTSSIDPIKSLTTKELTTIINQLPLGYRVVFNMYVIEGYSHKEISDLLEINIGTSKSQLFKAKKMLREKVEVLFNV